jgi:hypothetical protein
MKVEMVEMAKIVMISPIMVVSFWIHGGKIICLKYCCVIIGLLDVIKIKYCTNNNIIYLF